jgi:hypothetical protein
MHSGLLLKIGRCIRTESPERSVCLEEIGLQLGGRQPNDNASFLNAVTGRGADVRDDSARLRDERTHATLRPENAGPAIGDLNPAEDGKKDRCTEYCRDHAEDAPRPWR